MSETKPDDAQWFINPADVKVSKSKEKSPRRKDIDKKLLSTAAIAGVYVKSNLIRKAYPKKGLYCSTIGCDKYYSLKEELLDFWAPQETKREYHSDIYMNQSSVKHEIVQDHWHSTGILHPKHTNDEGNFKEIRCEFPEYGLSGKIDLILPDPEFINNFRKDAKENERKYWLATDIKETDTEQYWGIGSRLSQKYRTQLSLYIKWSYENLDAHETEGAFLYLDRDKPRKYKLIGYTKEEKLIQLAFDRSKDFWYHVNERKIPDFDGASEFISQQIELQKDRKWPILANLK